VKKQVEKLRKEPFAPGEDITQYFEMLPDHAPEKEMYRDMLQSTGTKRKMLQRNLRNSVRAGDIDVNIMTKVDKVNYDQDGTPLPQEYSDALSALRGFAKSNL